MRKMKKFADGGSDKYKARYDRKVADIESDYKKAQASKTGRAAEVAKAKYEQRMADAKDDLAKWTKSDRTATRAGEKAAERNLSLTRRYGSAEPKLEDKPLATPKGPSDAEAAKISTMAPKGKQTFKEAFAAARARGDKTFKWDGKPGTTFTTQLAGEKKAAPTPARRSPPAASTRTSTPAPAPKQVEKSSIPAAAKAVADRAAGYRAAFQRQDGQAGFSKAKTPAPKPPAQDPNWGRKVIAKRDAAAATKRRFLPDGSLNPAAIKPDGSVDMTYKAKGGSVRSVDGIAKRGKTRAPMKRK